MSAPREFLGPMQTNSDSKLGGPPVGHLTGGETAVIVLTVVGLAIVLWMIFYCRLLGARRDIDERNHGKEPESANDGRQGLGHRRMTEESTVVNDEEVELQQLPRAVLAAPRPGTYAEWAGPPMPEPVGRKKLWYVFQSHPRSL